MTPLAETVAGLASAERKAVMTLQSTRCWRRRNGYGPYAGGVSLDMAERLIGKGLARIEPRGNQLMLTGRGLDVHAVLAARAERRNRA